MNTINCNSESTIGDCGCSSYSGNYYPSLAKTAADCVNQGKYPIPFSVGTNTYDYTKDCYDNIKVCYECYEIADCLDYNNFPSGYCFTPNTTTTSTTTTTTTTPPLIEDCLDLESDFCCFPKINYPTPENMPSYFPGSVSPIVPPNSIITAEICCLAQSPTTTTTTTTTIRPPVTTSTTTTTPLPPQPTTTSTTTTTTTPCPCSLNIFAIQICNFNAAKDDNFNVYLNNTYIGALNLNQDLQVGSIFIAGANNIHLPDQSLACPENLMNIYYFNKNLLNLKLKNVLEMRNTQTNNNKNEGVIKIIGYSNLQNYCVLDYKTYNGENGASFKFDFYYNGCCPQGCTSVTTTLNPCTTTTTTTTTTSTTTPPPKCTTATVLRFTINS